MAGIVAFWQLIPPSLQPFFISGPCGFLFFGWLFFVIHNKKTAEELEQDRWDTQKHASLRTENDHKSLRIVELEEQLSSVRRSYEITIDRIRNEWEVEKGVLSQDRMRGWDLARAWYDVSYTLWHTLVTTTLLVPLEARPPIPEPLGHLEDRQGITPARHLSR